MKKLIVVLSLLSSYAFASKNIELKNAQKMLQKSTWAFEENKGQVTGADGKNVKFVFKDGNLSMFLMQSGIAYQFHKVTYPEGYKPLDKFASMKEHEKMEKLQSQIQTETYRMDVILEGANQNPKISTEGKSNDYIQYYNHNALDVRSYQKVTYYEVYPNIDWVVYVNKNAGINEPKVKYDFVVHPGGDPTQIKLKTEWVEELTSNDDGSLTMKNRMGSVTEQRPVSFQAGKDVKTNFVVNNNTISFQLEKFNINTDIVIDPGLLWGTYYGGSADEWGASCATDGNGNAYLAGWTASANNIASGGHQNIFGISVDAFLVKFNTNGIRQWATYYGGSSTDVSASCAVDGSGNVYIAGFTNSTSNIASGGHQNTFGGGTYGGFLVKFNTNGVRQWATYYGEFSDIEFKIIGQFCAVDGSGNVYLSGLTNSINNIASGGHQNTFGGGTYDAFLVKFNNNGIRQWATYYGGDGIEGGSSCAVDGNGNVYLSGRTNSINNIASGGHQNTFKGGTYDVFLVKFNNNGIRQWASYYGGEDIESIGYCSVDGSGNVYLSGWTNSINNIAFGGHQNSIGGGNDAFIAKFNNSGILQWATYFGGDSIDRGICKVDGSGNAYLTGRTQSKNGISLSGYQNNFGGGDDDAFIAKFNSSGVLQWATYFGGGANEFGSSCSVDMKGNVYLSGITNSTNNINSGGHQNSFGGGDVDAFLVKFDNTTNSSLSENTSNLHNIQIYPNPSENLLNIETNASEEWNAVITDMKGSQINQMQFNKSTQLDISSYAPGVYYIQLTNNEKVLNYKFMKK